MVGYGKPARWIIDDQDFILKYVESNRSDMFRRFCMKRIVGDYFPTIIIQMSHIAYNVNRPHMQIDISEQGILSAFKRA